MYREPRAGYECYQNTIDIPLKGDHTEGEVVQCKNMHRQLQRLCIIERSKWVQDEHHGSLMVNVITVSGKTAVCARGEIIEMVKSKLKTSLFTQHKLLLFSQPHD